VKKMLDSVIFTQSFVPRGGSNAGSARAIFRFYVSAATFLCYNGGCARRM
jgi:hypothetical protein